MKQHERPCNDCPWRRNSAPGWLGNRTAEQWANGVHGEEFVLCHTKARTDNLDKAPQCAGAAIYRRNVCKLPHDPRQLRLEADRQAVFANRLEFYEHHMKAVADIDEAREMIAKARGTAPSYYAVLPNKRPE